MTRQKTTGPLSPEKQKIAQLIFLWSSMIEECHKDPSNVEKKKKRDALFDQIWALKGSNIYPRD